MPFARPSVTPRITPCTLPMRVGSTSACCAVSIVFGSQRFSMSLCSIILTECALSHPTVQVHCKREE
jgi:hypothetical protein